MKRRLLPVILILFVFENFYSSNIGGCVTDFNSSEPINNALIEIRNTESDFIDSLFSDINGNWDYDLVAGIEEDFLPDDFRVRQNYPNPFNPSTNIDFQIPEAGTVEITIHNILGELLDYKSEILNIGSYTIKWNGAASAGVYFYTIRFKDRALTKKMIQLDGSSGSKGLSKIRSGGRISESNVYKSSSENYRIIISKFAYVPDTIQTSVSGGEFIQTILETIHSKAILADLHNDVLEIMAADPSYHLGVLNNKNHTDIPRMKTGGVDIQFFADWVSPSRYSNNPYEEALRMADIFKNEIELNSAEIEQAYNYEDAVRITSEGKIAGILAVEGGHAIENDLHKLKNLYDLGARYLTITWNNSMDWAVSAKDDRSKTVGLSDFGKDVIRTMDSLGMMIDVSHTGLKTIEDILQITDKPIIATHSGVRAILDHYRNLYDEQIIKIAESGGVIGVVFYPPFLTDGRTATIGTVIKHINYIVDLVGIDHVALGSDFDGIGDNIVSRLNDVSNFPTLTEALLKSGYSRDDIEKILGGNVLRVLQSVSMQ